MDSESETRDRLTGTDSLEVGQRLVSPNGDYKLIFQNDGNLVLYDLEEKPIWSANSGHRVDADSRVLLDGCKLRVDMNGVYRKKAWGIEIDLYRNDVYRELLRSSGLDDSKVLLRMQNDGNLVLYYDKQVLWATDTARKVGKRRPTNGNLSFLYVNEPLRMGDKLKSQNNDFVLRMEGDIVLRWSGNEIWRQRANKTDARPTKLELRANGKLELADDTGSIVWSTSYSGEDDIDSRLTSTDDGEMTIISDNDWLWSSHSGQDLSKRPKPIPLPALGPEPHRLRAGEKLSSGQSITSPNGRYKMFFQEDGNFVLCDDDDKTLWASGTNITAYVDITANEARLADDDNLTIGSSKVEFTFWSSKSSRRNSSGDAFLMVQDSGTAIIKSDDIIVWSTDKSQIQPFWPKCEPLPPGNRILRSSQYLPLNQPLTSSNGKFSAVLQPNGNLMVRHNTIKAIVWGLGDSGRTTAVQLTLSLKAELAIWASDESKIWSSGTELNDKASLTMRDDGKLTLNRDREDEEIWSNESSFPVCNGPMDCLRAGQSFALDQVLTAGDYEFGFTSACNLFTRDKQGNTTYYYTAPRAVDNAASLTCTDRYEIEIYDTENNLLWGSRHGGLSYDLPDGWSGDNRFLLTEHGEFFVLLKSEFAWMPCGELPSGSTPTPPGPGPDESFMIAGSTLKPGESLTSPNRRFKLTYQNDGNLVIYNDDDPLWDSGSLREGAPKEKAGSVTLQADGNLVMKNSKGVVRWSSNRKGKGDVVFRLQDDGNAVVYAGDKAIWASQSDRGRHH